MHVYNISGNEDLNGLLRMMASRELYLNSSHYAETTWPEHSQGPFSKESIFTSMLSNEATNRFDRSKDIVDAIKIEAVRLITEEDRFTTWGTLLHMFAISSSIGRQIYSIYPDANEYLCPHYNRIIQPRDTSSSTAIYILWTRDGNLDNRFDEPFQPNHFVPLLLDVCWPYDENEDFEVISTIHKTGQVTETPQESASLPDEQKNAKEEENEKEKEFEQVTENQHESASLPDEQKNAKEEESEKEKEFEQVTENQQESASFPDEQKNTTREENEKEKEFEQVTENQQESTSLPDEQKNTTREQSEKEKEFEQVTENQHESASFPDEQKNTTREENEKKKRI